MADSFFGFNTSLTALEHDDALDLDEEEEYDALNHETFGENAFQGDWEEDHTRFAEVTENSRTYRNSFNSERDDDLDLETSISQLVLEDGEEEDEEDGLSHVKLKASKSINIPGNFKLESSGDYNSSPVWSIDSPKPDDISLSKQLHQAVHLLSKPSSLHFLPPQIPRIPTVQELERDLIQRNKQSSKGAEDLKGNNLNHILNQGRNLYSNVNQQLNLGTPNPNAASQNVRSKFTYSSGTSKFPPGFGGHQRGPFPQPPQQQEMVLLRNNVNMPMMMGPRLLPPYILPTPHPLLLAQNARLVPPHPMMRFMPPHPVLMQQQQQQQQQQQHQHQNVQMQQNKMQHRGNQFDGHRNNTRNNSNGPSWMNHPDRRGAGDFDEYAGLMNNRERNWLQNIQAMQLTTDKPHIDDYYYVQWLRKHEKERKSKDQTKNGMRDDKQYREPYMANNRNQQSDGHHRDRKDSERDSVATPSPRVYVPLQFENSLGRPQCVSATAPRKMIDVEIVSEPQVESVPLASHRDSRKTKKLLLELERLYLLAMEINDIDNNVPLEEPHLSKSELVDKIMSSFLNEGRFVNFMCIRKGKTLLLRILTHLNEMDRSDQVSDIWCRVVKSFSTIIRRDQNDGLLVQMYPFFKKWIKNAGYTNLSSMASLLLPGRSQNNVKSSSRAVSPSSGKSALSIALTSKFGVSVVSSILSRGEAVYPTLDDREKLDWTTFIFNIVKHMTSIPNLENVPTPLDPLPANVLTAILNRSTELHIQDYASAKRVLDCFQ